VVIDEGRVDIARCNAAWVSHSVAPHMQERGGGAVVPAYGGKVSTALSVERGINFELPVLPLADEVVLPGMVAPITLDSEAQAAVDAARSAADSRLILVPRIGGLENKSQGGRGRPWHQWDGDQPGAAGWNVTESVRSRFPLATLGCDRGP
jgi:hypothetical protein